MSAAERIAVMEGELEGIDLVEVLQVVGIGRQYTGVELRKADQSTLGVLYIKAGKVVSAMAGTTRGRDAFFQLFQQVNTESRKFFHVFRMETPAELPEPIGPLGNLVLEALARSKTGPQKTSSGVMTKPTAVKIEPTPVKIEPERRSSPDIAPASAPSSASRGAAPPPSRRSSSTAIPAVTPVIPGPASSTHGSGPSSQRSAPSAEATPPVSARPQPANENEVVARQGSGGSSGATVRRIALPGSSASSDSDGSSTRERGSGGDARVVMAVVSPKGGSGKTTVALNLALSFARQERSVILVDGDINGDVLSAIGARERAAHGVIDVLTGKVGYEAALLRTVLPHFRILPALGEQLPDMNALLSEHSQEWRKLLHELSEQAEIVIVDSPAGMFGGTRQLLSGCTHVLGVLQAELIASRSFATLERALELMPGAERPEVVGIVLNMLQTRKRASVQVLQDACAHLPKGWLLDTAIPRSDAFLEATEEGLPLRLLDELNPPAVSWLFDTLASEISARLALTVAERKPRQLLI
ncbi:MAG: chromosome partitioning protein ParA [Pseudomonadota bacterium]